MRALVRRIVLVLVIFSFIPTSELFAKQDTVLLHCTGSGEPKTLNVLVARDGKWMVWRGRKLKRIRTDTTTFWAFRFGGDDRYREPRDIYVDTRDLVLSVLYQGAKDYTQWMDCIPQQNPLYR